MKKLNLLVVIMLAFTMGLYATSSSPFIPEGVKVERVYITGEFYDPPHFTVRYELSNGTTIQFIVEQSFYKIPGSENKKIEALANPGKRISLFENKCENEGMTIYKYTRRYGYIWYDRERNRIFYKEDQAPSWKLYYKGFDWCTASFMFVVLLFLVYLLFLFFTRRK